MINKLDYKDCTLCQVCINVCPKNCISLEFSKEGFKYPVIDKNKCVNCNICEKKCPILNPLEDREILKKSYAGINLNEEERYKSSSGGVFSVLAKYILDKNGIVCGAAFDEKFQVNHVLIDKKDDLSKLRGSKYIQSNTKDIYNKVEEQLITGKTVLFTGCPCQVGGLHKYLGKDYENLYTVDLICHGIPSQNIFNRYIELLQKKYKDEIVEFLFRDKSKGWDDSSIKVEFKNGHKYQKPIIYDPYMRGYFNNIYLKSACYNCKFRNFKSGSDITIGDLWGAEIEFNDIDYKKGLSAVIINTKKGIDLKNGINNNYNIDLRDIDYNKILKYNKALEGSFEKSPYRNRYLKLVEEEKYDTIFKKVCKEKKIKKAIRLLRSKLGKVKRMLLRQNN